jgi:DNA-binding MarR family transcriptional regulator
VTKLVDRLCRDGLVRREPNPDDRRGVLVHITARGRHLAASASKEVGAIRFGVDLDDDSLHRIVSSLAAYRHGAGDM